MSNFWKKLKYINRQRNNKTRRIKYFILLFFLSFYKKRKVVLIPEKCNKICILLQGKGIGDAIVISGFINALVQNNRSVSVIAEKRLSFLFKNIIRVDNIFEYDSKEPLSLFKEKIRNNFFDVIVDFYNFDDSIIDKAKTILSINHTYSLGFNQPKFTVYTNNILYSEEQHISHRLMVALDQLNIKSDKFEYKLTINPSIEKITDEFINREIRPNRLIIFNPFAGCTFRTMSEKQIYQVMDYLETLNDYKTIVFDFNHSLNLDKYSRILNNSLSTFDSACYLIKKSDLVLTVDTSIVHVANAFNIKQIAIYNNRIIDQKFQNNIIWSPNHPLAKQLFTEQYLNTSTGDPISSFNIDILLDEIKKSIL